MGGLTIASFLGRNPEIAGKLAGVIYSAPYFGPHETLGIDFGKRLVTSMLAEILDEFAIVAPLPLHKVCKSKTHMRSVLMCKKANPMMSLKVAASCFKN